MTNRMLVALGAAVLFVGPTLAQEPDIAPPLTAAPTLAPPSYPVGPAPVYPVGPPPAYQVGHPAAPASSGQFWFTADYLVGWFSPANLPPLVTTSPAGTPLGQAGVLGQNTTTLFGGNVNADARSGFRIEAGDWFTAQRDLGIEAGGMVLESQATLFSAASTNGNPIVARPFFNALTNAQDALPISFPGTSSGSVVARASSGNFYELHLDLTENVCDKNWLRIDSMLGYRFFRYDEGLRISQTVTPVGGNSTTSVDDFGAKNIFHGCDLGVRTQFLLGDVSLGLLTKLAVGNLHRDVTVNGSQTTGVPATTQPGGVLALSSNLGSDRGNDWTIIPEFGANLSYRVSPNLQLRVGYSLLFLERISRASDQVDLALNPNLFPPLGPNSTTGPARPTFNLNRADVSIQSLSLGMELTY